MPHCVRLARSGAHVAHFEVAPVWDQNGVNSGLEICFQSMPRGHFECTNALLFADFVAVVARFASLQVSKNVATGPKCMHTCYTNGKGASRKMDGVRPTTSSPECLGMGPHCFQTSPRGTRPRPFLQLKERRLRGAGAGSHQMGLLARPFFCLGTARKERLL